MRIEEQEGLLDAQLEQKNRKEITNANIVGEIAKLQQEVRSIKGYNFNTPKTKNSRKEYQTQPELKKVGIRGRQKAKRDRQQRDDRYDQKLIIGDRISITNKITVKHKENLDLDKYAAVINISTTKHSNNTVEKVWARTDGGTNTQRIYNNVVTI